MSETRGGIGDLVGKDVVLDTSSQFVYIGRLAAVGDGFIELDDADVHDGTDSQTSKEVYLIDARKYGIKKNRRRVLVRADQVVSLSSLEDVIEY